MSGKNKMMIFLSCVVLVSVIILSVMPRPGIGKITGQDKKIAVIYVEGAISSRRSPENFLSDASGGTSDWIQQLHKATEDPNIGAVVLRINSPGGSSTAAEEFGEEIKKSRAQGKIIVTSMGDIAASAGYWLAAGTNKIYANSSTLTGSIGVYMPYSNWEELYKKIGIHQEKIKSGAHKDILANDRPMTEEERVILQTIVNEIYDDFVNQVATGRNMEPSAVRQLADGRIYTGKQALKVGLVDEIGNLQDAITGAAALANIQGKPVIEEMGHDNPFSAIFSSHAQLSVIKEIFRVGSVDGENVVPLLLPERWRDL